MKKIISIIICLLIILSLIGCKNEYMRFDSESDMAEVIEGTWKCGTDRLVVKDKEVYWYNVNDYEVFNRQQVKYKYKEGKIDGGKYHEYYVMDFNTIKHTSNLEFKKISENIDMSENNNSLISGQYENENPDVIGNLLNTQKCESVFKEKYPEILLLPFHSNDKRGTSYFSINDGNVMFKTNSNFVEYINLEKNGYKIGIYFADNEVLEGQKIRLFMRSGFMSYPDLTLKEQYLEMISLIENLEIYEDTLPEFEEFETNVKLTKNLVGGKHYEYYPNNKIKFIVEESLKNGNIESRGIYCDIY